MKIEIPSWIADLFQSNDARASIDSFSVAGLALTIENDGPSVHQWLQDYLAPIEFDHSEKIIRNWTIKITHGTDLLLKLVDFLASSELTPTRVKISKTIWNASVNQDVSICYRPSEGIVWIIDRSKNQMALFISARTKYPMLAIASTVRDIIFSHMSDQGWHVFHAGAVKISGKTQLIIGNSGAGKTSLIIALMAQGAKFISNERILLKYVDGKVQVFPFPMVIAIGLGTAEQYPILSSFVENSDLLIMPTRRFSPRSIKGINRSEWWKRSDKIQLLAGELVDVMQSSAHSGSGAVSKIIIPDLKRNAEFKAYPVEDAYLHKVLKKNHLTQERARHYPNWIPLGFGSETEDSFDVLFEKLCQIDAARVEFFKGDKTLLPDLF